uniref:DNA repair endonuclease XPF n=1 Tax=Ciona savignyi TaxID=51511 RepID=H2Y933_CIOSA
ASSMLGYENQIFLDMYQENALLVLCEGLGLDRIFLNFLRLYSDLKELVFVLNTDPVEQEYYIEKLKSLGTSQLPCVVTSEYGAKERKRMYARGGIFFASSRILVMDLLVDRIPIHLVSGLLVTKAHKMADACQEPFIVRLFRQKNKEGFIKGFTDNPVSMVGGYGRLEKVMKNLFVGKVFLWPRFHLNVIECMDKRKPEVIEIGVVLTPAMQIIQTSLLEIVLACLKELKNENPGLETDEFTVENSLGRSFDRSIRTQLDPVWNQLSPKSKHLVSDLRTLRLLLRALSQYTCITFLQMLESSSGTQRAFGSNPGWIFLDAANNLFQHARARVHGKKSKQKDSKAKTCKELIDQGPLLEPSPKLSILTEIMDEIKEANKETEKTELGCGKVMICVSEMRGIYMLRDFFQYGTRASLLRLYNKTYKKSLLVPTGGGIGGGNVIKFPKKSNSLNFDQSQVLRGSPEMSQRTLITGDNLPSTSKDDLQTTEENAEIDAIRYSGMKVMDSPETHLYALHGNPDPYVLARALEEIQPRYVILYDCSIHFVRQLEIYKACRPGVPLRVYFLTFQSSAEEQVYLTSLRKEKEAFHSLIQEKATMVVPKEREGKNEDDPQFDRSNKPAYDPRMAGGQRGCADEKKQTIVVDMREFRSELPSLLHKRGVEIEPITLEVGDYILTTNICVERKSLSDLIGSLNSGRLYTQCVAMRRHYSQPMLLIEFDANKAFSFQARGVAGAKLSLKELNQKLTLLLLHFPMLRLAWCSSPSAAAELFQELKLTREQPDPVKAASIGATEQDGVTSETKYNSAAYDFLLKLPGINSKNCRSILDHVTDLQHLFQLTEDKLEEILSSKINARQV